MKQHWIWTADTLWGTWHSDSSSHLKRIWQTILVCHQSSQMIYLCWRIIKSDPAGEQKWFYFIGRLRTDFNSQRFSASMNRPQLFCRQFSLASQLWKQNSKFLVAVWVNTNWTIVFNCSFHRSSIWVGQKRVPFPTPNPSRYITCYVVTHWASNGSGIAMGLALLLSFLHNKHLSLTLPNLQIPKQQSPF